MILLPRGSTLSRRGLLTSRAERTPRHLFCGKPPPRDRSADRSADQKTENSQKTSPFEIALQVRSRRRTMRGCLRRATPHVRCGASLLAHRARHLADRSRENLRTPHLYKPSLLQPSCHTFVTDTVVAALANAGATQVRRPQAGRELRSARRAHCATDSARPLLTITLRPRASHCHSVEHANSGAC